MVRGTGILLVAVLLAASNGAALCRLEASANEVLVRGVALRQSDGQYEAKWKTTADAMARVNHPKYKRFVSSFFQAFVKHDQRTMESSVASNSDIVGDFIADYLDLAVAMADHPDIIIQHYDWSPDALDFADLATVVAAVEYYARRMDPAISNRFDRRFYSVISRALDAAKRAQQAGRDEVSIHKYLGIAQLADLYKATEVMAFVYTQLSALYARQGDMESARQYSQKAKLIRGTRIPRCD